METSKTDLLTIGKAELGFRPTTAVEIGSGRQRSLLRAGVKDRSAKKVLGNSLWERIQSLRGPNRTHPGSVLAAISKHGWNCAKGKEGEGCGCAKGLHCEGWGT
jgi:hypothetical protein